MKTFAFNECGVCLNPNKYKVYEGKNWYHSAIVYTAETERGWVYGRDVHCIGDELGNWGACSGCDNESDMVYVTEKDAFLAGVQNISQMKNVSKQILKAIKEQQFFPEYQQLELF